MGVARDAAVGTDPGQAPINTLRHAQALPPIGAVQPAASRASTRSIRPVGSTSTAEPVIVSLPDSRGRYIDARVLDMWTNVVWSTSAQFATRAAGIKAQTIAFVGPCWQGDLPKGVTRVDVPTRNAWVSVRIQSNGTRDLTAVRKLQHAIRVAPLSVYTGDTRSASITPPRSDAAASAAAAAAGSPAAQVAALDANGFFSRLAQALPDDQSADHTGPIPHALKILAGPRRATPGDPVKLPSASDAIAAGLADGRERRRHAAVEWRAERQRLELVPATAWATTVPIM